MFVRLLIIDILICMQYEYATYYNLNMFIFRLRVKISRKYRRTNTDAIDGIITIINSFISQFTLILKLSA